MERVSRKEAKIKGLGTYFTSKPCKYGHVAPRRTNNGTCIQCQQDLFYDRHKQYYHQYAEDNKEQISAYQKQWYVQNGNRKKQQQKDWWHHKRTEESKKRWKEYNKWYNRVGPGRLIQTAYSAKRRAKKRNATPPWYQRERKQIQSLYEEAHNLTLATGVVHHVDHIVPLAHNLVCGLHYLANLQILTAEENSRKRNQFQRT